jgi:hypothetical protein
MTARTTRRLMLMSLAAVGPLGFTGCGLLKPGPAKVVGSFLEDVERSELDKAVQLVSTRIRQMLGDNKLRAGLEQQGRQMRSKGGIASITTQSELVTGDVAKVSSIVEFKNGSKTSDNTKLIKEQNDWKIDMDK